MDTDGVMARNDDDIFIGVDGETGDLSFSWVEDNEWKAVIVGGSDCVVPPLMNDSATTTTQEDLSRRHARSTKQISPPKNTKKQTKVDNFNDLVSPSKTTAEATTSHPSNNDRGHVHMDTDMEPLPPPPPPHQDDSVAIQVVSEGQAPGRKNPIKWTDDEQKLFLMGMTVFKDKWTLIRKHFVRTKSSSQIGNHVKTFKKRMNRMNRKNHSINDIRLDDVTREDVERLAPENYRRAVLSAMAACSNGEKTSVQQHPNAALEEDASGCSIPTRPRPVTPAVQETITNPTSLIAQPASFIAFACSNVGPMTLQPASSIVAYADGHQTQLVQPSPRPHLGAAYLGYPSSTYYPANYQPLSLPPMLRCSYTGLAHSPALPQAPDTLNPRKHT